MKKIKVLHTGGTIGSTVSDSVAGLSVKRGEQLIESYRSKRSEGAVLFEAETVMSIHSENISLSDWTLLYKRVRLIGERDYDGVIITHGTDTLAYTAAFLSVMLRHKQIPVLIVSGDYPLEDGRTNGYDNFTAAVDFIVTAGIPGVFVPYGKEGEVSVHIGARLMQITSYSHEARSAGGVRFGVMEDGKFIYEKSPKNPEVAEFWEKRPEAVPEIREYKDILCVMAVPGMDYGYYKPEKKPAAVLHGLYHSGTARAAALDGTETVIEYADWCRRKGIDLYAAPGDSEITQYPAAQKMRAAGINFMEDMSYESAYVKLVIGYGAFGKEEEREKFMNENSAFERLLR